MIALNKTGILRPIILTVMALTLAACAGTPQNGHGRKPQTHVSDDESRDESGRPLPVLEAAYKRNNDDPVAALNYAEALREHNRLQRAAIVLGPFAQKGGQKNAGIYAEYGAIQAAMGNYGDAEQYARKALAINPKNGEAYHVLGIALDAEGKHDQAEVAFRKALDNWQGNQSPVLNNLGLNLAAQGSLDEAVETLRKAVSLSPDNKEIERNLRIVLALRMQTPPKSAAAATPAHKPARKSAAH